jgi:hypothetical protein
MFKISRRPHGENRGEIAYIKIRGRGTGHITVVHSSKVLMDFRKNENR